MTHATNALGQPIGLPLPGWTARPRPPKTVLAGRFCRLEPLDPDSHAADLFAAYGEDTAGRNWTYLSYGPFARPADFRAWMDATALGDDPLFHAIVESASGKAVGVASLLRIDPAFGVIEVGHINYAPPLQRTAAATEAMFLLMRRVFDELGYRRYEWKCDSLNAPSRRAAERLGFTYEGIFRQAMTYKGRNRDTAWYSIIDTEWPALQKGYAAWLAGVSDDGMQRRPLAACIAAARSA